MKTILVPVWLQESQRFVAREYESFGGTATESLEKRAEIHKQELGSWMYAAYEWPVGPKKEIAVCACLGCQGKLPRQRKRSLWLPVDAVVPPVETLEVLP
jgi:hypothetical protein